MKPWFYREKRGYLLDFQMPDSADQMPIGQEKNLRCLDAEVIVEQLHQAGVRALYVHAKDNQGNCYYNTRFGHKHTGIGERDLMREFSAACRARNMVVLYYVQLSRERRGAEEEAYVGRDEAGNPVVKRNSGPLLPARDDYPAMCLNGPGRDYQINCLRELAEGYDFDGFWLDNPDCWMRLNPCYCDTCRTKYREDTGCELPTSADQEGFTPAYRRYIRYKRRQNTVILREIVEAIRSANPRLTVTHNGAAGQWWHGSDLCDFDDYASHEFHYAEGYGHLAWICRANAAMKPGVPFEVEVWRFFNLLGAHHMVRGYEVRPVPQLFTEMATILANGGFVQYYDQVRPDGGLDRLSLERMKGAFDQVAALEPFLLEGQRRVPYAAVVWSKETDAFALRSHAVDHQKERDGFHFALMESKTPHEVLTDRDLARGEFRDARVVVLPDVVCMSEAAAAHVREFVRKGGGLVASYRTGLADEFGQPREAFSLGDVFGCNYVEPFSFTYGFRTFSTQGPLTIDVPLDWPMTIWKKMMLKVRLRAGARGVGNVVNPMRGMMMGHPPQEVTPWPAAVVQEYGAGRVVYLPYQAGAAYADYGHPHQRQLIVNAVRWAAGEPPPVEVKAPDPVEAVLWEVSPSRWNLHLVNRVAGGPARTTASVITEVIPVVDLEIKVGRRAIGATLQPAGEALALAVDEGVTTIRIPRLDIYGIVEMDFS